MFEQITIDELLNPEELKITKPIRLIELFAGVGSQAMALRDIGADFESYKVVEFDKYAIKSYNAIHGTNFPTLDIRDIKGSDLEIVDKDKYCYICFYSFPCTDLSLAGLQLGMQRGSNTRSSLLWEVERLLRESEHKPQILIMENVPQVHGTNNVEPFKEWLNFLSSLGYQSYWQDMDAADYGIPQHRERTFVISIEGRKHFKFPQPVELKTSMNDYFEDEVEEKFYCNNKRTKELIDKIVAENKLAVAEQSRAEQSRAEEANCPEAYWQRVCWV